MSEQNKALVRQAYDSFKASRIDKLLSLMSNDISWTLPEVPGVPFGGKKTSLAAVGEFFVLVNNLQENLRFDVNELVAEGDRVVALGNYSLRVRHTKREFQSDFAHVFTIRDGKIVAFNEYMDTAACRDAYQKIMSA
jgi:ketosteroid isomerase-like protein